MNRREAAKRTAILLTGTMVPGWIGRAFGQHPSGSPGEAQAAQAAKRAARRAERERESRIENAYRRAKTLGKPLLVLVVPREEAMRWERGQVFGQFLTLASEEWLADLALCEVDCRTVDQVRPLIDRPRDVEPLMCLIETSGSSPTIKAFDGKIPADVRPPVTFFTGLTGKDGDQQRRAQEEASRRYEAGVAARVRFLGELIRSAVAPDIPTMRARAEQAAGALDLEELRQISEAADKRTVPAARLQERAAAIVRLQAETADSSRRAELIRWLAAGARARLLDRAPMGSRWGSSSGCGADHYTSRDPNEDDQERSMTLCGMGSVPPLSNRFLDFYTNTAS